MSAQGVRLSDSAFLANVDQRDRSLWRFLGTLFGGLAGGLVVGLACGAILIVIFAISVGFSSGDVMSSLRQVGGLITANGANLESSLLLLGLAVSTNCPVAATFVAIAALIGRRRFRTYVTAAPAFRWQLLLAGLLLSALFIGPMVILGQIADPKSAPFPVLTMGADLPTRAIYVVSCVVMLTPLAAAEEVIFRGWLLRQTAAVAPAPWAILAFLPPPVRRAIPTIVMMVLNGAAFAAVHGDFLPLGGAVLGAIVGLAGARLLKQHVSAPISALLGGLGALAGGYAIFLVVGWVGDASAFLTRAVMGAGFVYMTLRLGGIEFSTGAHASNNILIVLFIEPLTLKQAAGPALNGDVLGQSVFLFAVYVAMAELTARWAPLRRLSGADQTLDLPAIAAAEHFA